MEKKKLGLSGKSKLELSKTVRGGTVRQSFSHGRVKSVEVEVKKVRTFNKNGSNSVSSEEKRSVTEDSHFSGISRQNDNKDNSSNKDKLQKLKEEAQNDRIARENELSSTDQKKPIETFIEDNKEKKQAKINKSRPLSVVMEGMHTASTLDRASLQMSPFRELRYCSELQMSSFYVEICCKHK